MSKIKDNLIKKLVADKADNPNKDGENKGNYQRGGNTRDKGNSEGGDKGNSEGGDKGNSEGGNKRNSEGRDKRKTDDIGQNDGKISSNDDNRKKLDIDKLVDQINQKEKEKIGLERIKPKVLEEKQKEPNNSSSSEKEKSDNSSSVVKNSNDKLNEKIQEEKQKDTDKEEIKNNLSKLINLDNRKITVVQKEKLIKIMEKNKYLFDHLISSNQHIPFEIIEDMNKFTAKDLVQKLNNQITNNEIKFNIYKRKHIPCENDGKPKPDDPNPKPKPDDPNPKPRPDNPNPKPRPDDPNPKPRPDDPNPKPRPDDPNPSPKPDDPNPSPKPDDPKPRPKPNDPIRPTEIIPYDELNNGQYKMEDDFNIISCKSGGLNSNTFKGIYIL